MTNVIDAVVEDALRELADESDQRRLWLAAEGPEVSSFIECASRLFEDSGLILALEDGATVYTPEIDAAFTRLDRLLSRIDGRHPPEDILNDPRLGEARALARQLLIDLRRFGADAE